MYVLFYILYEVLYCLQSISFIHITMNDLYNLGVRVSALEDRVGNVKFSGDASKDHTMSFDLAYVEHKFGKNHMVDIGRYTQSFGDGLIYSSNFDGIGYTTQVGKLKVNAAYGYPTLGRFSKASKDNNSEMSLINLSAPVNKHLNIGGMFAHVGTTNVKMGNGKTTNDFNNVYGFNAQYNIGKFATNVEWVTATGLSNSDVWNVGVKWGDYKITKKNSWRVALDYYNQEKNAPAVRHKNMKVIDYYRADLLFKF